jgi:hypothetical protein
MDILTVDSPARTPVPRSRQIHDSAPAQRRTRRERIDRTRLDASSNCRRPPRHVQNGPKCSRSPALAARARGKRQRYRPAIAHHRLCVREPLRIDAPGRRQTPPRLLLSEEPFRTLRRKIRCSDEGRGYQHLRRVIAKGSPLLWRQAAQLVIWFSEKRRRDLRIISDHRRAKVFDFLSFGRAHALRIAATKPTDDRI